MKLNGLLPENCKARLVETLTALMTQENLTPTQLAAKAGLQRSVLWRWLKSDAKVRTASVLKLAPVLGLNTGWIFQGYTQRGRRLTGETIRIERLLARHAKLCEESAAVEMFETLEDIGMAAMRYFHALGIPSRFSSERKPRSHEVVIIIDDPSILYMPVMVYFIRGHEDVLYELHCGELRNPVRYQYGSFCVQALRDCAAWIKRAISDKKSGKLGAAENELRQQFDVAFANHHAS